MSLESELREEKVAHLDLSGFAQVESGATVRMALAQLRAERQNVCLVTQDGQLRGIFTDRDVLRKVVNSPASLDVPIDQVMTANPITVHPDSSALDALHLMDENHFRNLPAVDEQGKIVGNMTHQAVIAYLAARYPEQVLNRPPQSDQFPRKPEGG
ncbi:MAG: CBS domain-containing protein [Caldilineaceae bacterium]